MHLEHPVLWHTTLSVTCINRSLQLQLPVQSKCYLRCQHLILLQLPCNIDCILFVISVVVTVAICMAID